MANLEIRIDWLTVTKTGGEAVTTLNRALYCANEILDMIGLERTDFPVPGKAAAFYQYNLKYAEGLWVDVSTNLDIQGIRVTMSGSYLLTVKTYPIIKNIKDFGLNVTRVDVAIDVKGAGVTVPQFAEAYRKGHTGRKYVNSYVEGTTGSTFYIGSRTSEKMVRIYDKAAESGKEGDWIRFELECKGDSAIGALNSLYKRDFGVFAGLIASMYGVPDSALNHLFRDVITEGDIKIQKDESDGLGWWIKSVAPALSRLKRETPERYKVVISILADNGHLLDG